MLNMDKYSNFNYVFPIGDNYFSSPQVTRVTKVTGDPQHEDPKENQVPPVYQVIGKTADLTINLLNVSVKYYSVNIMNTVQKKNAVWRNNSALYTVNKSNVLIYTTYYND